MIPRRIEIDELGHEQYCKLVDFLNSHITSPNSGSIHLQGNRGEARETRFYNIERVKEVIHDFGIGSPTYCEITLVRNIQDHQKGTLDDGRDMVKGLMDLLRSFN